MGRAWLLVCVLLSVTLGCGPVLAEDDTVGSDPGQRAPEVTATTWLNTHDDASPLEGDGDHRLMMLEFWGTWCGPCVRSMPKVQRLWDRYRAQGLLVIAITREAAGEVRPFLEDKGYTMPVACDPTQSCISQFRLEGWPTTYLIDRDHRVVWRGAPYGVEPEIEKALGLESSPKTLLTQCLDAEASGDEAALRPLLERLVAKAPATFDLADWAGSALGEVPPAVETPKQLSAKDAVKLLDQARKTWKDEAKRKGVLEQFACAVTDGADLGAWSRAWFAKSFPLDAAELKTMLEEKRYSDIVDAFLLRDAPSSLYKLAAKDDGLVAYCNKSQQEAFVSARKGLMGLTYWMGDEPLPEDFDSEAFSRDLAVSGVAMNAERNKVVGIMIGGETIMKDVMPSWIDQQLGRAFLMDALASGRPLATKKLAKKVEDERDRVLKALRRQYG